MNSAKCLTKSFFWKILHSKELASPTNNEHSSLDIFKGAVLQVIESNLAEYILNPKCKFRIILSDGVYMSNVYTAQVAQGKIDRCKSTGMLENKMIISVSGILHKSSILIMMDYEIIRDDVLVWIGSPVLITGVKERYNFIFSKDIEFQTK
jgi:hypothetical protein